MKNLKFETEFDEQSEQNQPKIKFETNIYSLR